MTTLILGDTPDYGELPLISGSDYSYMFEWQDPIGVPGPFPAGARLYYQFPTETWEFAISGNIATIIKESDAADAVDNSTPFKLVLSEQGSPSKESVLVIGTVRRYGVRTEQVAVI
jgi:hypothetical protein